MAIKPYQSGIFSIGHFDMVDTDLAQVKGGEVVVFDFVDSSLMDKAAPDVYSHDGMRTALRLATPLDQGPFFLADIQDNAAFVTPGYELTTLFGRNQSFGSTQDASSKIAIYSDEGFYSVSSTVVDTATINEATEMHSRLYTNSEGKLTTTPDGAGAIVGFFIDYRLGDILRSKKFQSPETFSEGDSVIIYKTNADGYLNLNFLSTLIGQEGTLGLPSDGVYSDGYVQLTTSTTVADAIDNLNEVVFELSKKEIGIPSDGTYLDGYFPFNFNTTVADAVDNLNEVVSEISAIVFPTGNDGYVITELGGVGAYRPLPPDQFITVSDLSARDLVPTANRTEGMFCYVESNNTTYYLRNGTSNSQWVSTSITNRYDSTGPSVDVFVDGYNGDDKYGDGLSFGTAYQSIGRALLDIPSVPLKRFFRIRCQGVFGVSGPLVINRVQANDGTNVIGDHGIAIEGEPEQIDITTVVNSVQQGSDITTIDLDVGSLPLSVIANKTFVKATRNQTIEWFPVLDYSDPILSIVAPSVNSIVAGDIIQIRDVAASIANLYATLPGSSLAGFILTDGYIAGQPSYNIASGTVKARLMGISHVANTLFLENVVASGINESSIEFDDSLGNIHLTNSELINTSVQNKAAVFLMENASVGAFRHLHPTEQAKIVAEGSGRYLMFDPKVFNQGNIAVLARNGAVIEYKSDTSVGDGISTVFSIENASYLNYEAGSASGTVSGTAVVVHEMSGANGIEDHMSSVVSTPVGQDVQVGSSLVSFGSLPQTDIVELSRVK